VAGPGAALAAGLKRALNLKRTPGAPTSRAMDPSRYALVQGMEDTRVTLARWRADPWPALKPWLAGAFAVTIGLLFATYVVARNSTPDVSGFPLSGHTIPGTLGDVGHILFRNSLVLALHAFACVAGFIAGSSLPLQAQHHAGWKRTLHDRAGQGAILFVVAATSFSLCTQAYVLGAQASTLAAQEHMSIAVLLIGLTPHAIPELVALFLPLAAWIIASRQKRWSELLAATVVTVAVAIPMLISSALIEVYVTPHIILRLRG
jgi:Stage II sporulation protein M